MIHKLTISFFLTLLTSFAFAQLTLKITAVPSSTPASDDLFIAGNFQGWNPSDPNSQLTKNNNNNTYEITLSPNEGLLEFKFTRGSWATVEGNASGGFVPNRTYNYTGGQATVELTIAGWEDLGGGGGGNSTTAVNVFILDDNYFIPQLNRNRRIWIYLPPDYETSTKNYPVLYMHDGQNVFDQATSFSGEWEVDETLNQLFDEGDYGCIVVAIDNGGQHRIDEYCPWENADYGGGQGAAYLDFIVETLKPQIDADYRTLPQREYTGIAGSSLGALISKYGLIEHQDVFSKAGCFSPAYWINTEVYAFVGESDKQFPMKVYMNAGTTEGNGSVVGDVNGMEGALENADFTPEEIFKIFHTDGAHSEWYWAREFGEAYEWLFGDLNLTNTEENLPETINIHPNPVNDYLYLQNFSSLKNPQFEITDYQGKKLKSGDLSSSIINMQDLADGTYVVNIFSEGKLALVEIVIFQK